MDLSPTHLAAREAACRVPALAASLALLVEDTQRASIALYGTTRPDPGDPPGGSPVVVISMDSDAGAVDSEDVTLSLTTPIEGQVTGAGGSGTAVVWARITGGAGDWWADASVSDESGSGEIKISGTGTTLYDGAFCRITSAVFQG